MGRATCIFVQIEEVNSLTAYQPPHQCGGRECAPAHLEAANHGRVESVRDERGFLLNRIDDLRSELWMLQRRLDGTSRSLLGTEEELAATQRVLRVANQGRPVAYAMPPVGQPNEGPTSESTPPRQVVPVMWMETISNTGRLIDILA